VALTYLLLLVFAAAFFIFLLSYIFIFGERLILARRVNQVVGSPVVNIREKELSKPLADRLIKPVMAKIISVLARVLPSEKEAILEKKLARAGLAGRISPLELMVIKYLVALFLGLGMLSAAGIMHLASLKTLVLVIVFIWAGMTLPEYFLTVRARNRSMEVEASLPQILDLLTVSVEAGLGFDGAVYKVISKTRGLLPLELKRMMQEIKVGKVRRDALKDLAERFDVNDLNNFISAIILGEQLGISIGNVLRRQADQIRQRRRQNAEEKAMKAPVKMLFPLIFLIFPALFIVILGPGAIQIFENLLN